MDDQTGVVTTSSNDEDPFAGCTPLPGLEHLGRHLRDARGNPSGSPANFEFLRGKPDPMEVILTAEEIVEQERRVVEALLATYPKPT